MRSSRYIVLERKSMPIVAWYVLSKESYMKRVIRDVFPTIHTCQQCMGVEEEGDSIPDCSPKKTSLNFLSGFVYEPTACAIVAKSSSSYPLSLMLERRLCCSMRS